MNNRYDFIVIGGGILGMSTAWQLQQAWPGRSVLIRNSATPRALRLYP